MPHQSRSQRRRQPVRTASSQDRQQQRRPARPAPEPIDYSKEYTWIRRDLQRIALLSILLFAGMGVIYFVL
jgi:hypothetical protein